MLGSLLRFQGFGLTGIIGAFLGVFIRNTLRPSNNRDLFQLPRRPGAIS